MMEDFTERMNQELRKQGVLLASQREQELLAQKQAAQEKQVPSPNSVFRQLIKETCGIKVYEEEKQNMEDTMLELLKDCRQKELYCIHNNVDDLMKNFKVIHKENIIPLNETPQISPSIALAPVFSIMEPEDSLSIGDEHLNTIPEKESNELMKSSVENLVPIPSESEDIFDDECELTLCDDSPETQFSTFSNPLFDSNDDFSSSDDESFSKEDVPMEEFKIYSNPLFDFDEEIISSKENSISNEGEIRLIEKLLYDNSSPRPPENLSIESFFPSPIPVEDSDSHMEEIDLFFASDDLMPLGIENDNYDSEGDIRFLEEFLRNDPLPLPEIESSNLDHFNVPSSPRPPPEPPDVEICFDVEPDTTVKNDFEELNEDECFDPPGGGGGEIDVFANVEYDDYFPFTFIIRVFLPFLTYPEVSPLLLSTGSEDTIFDFDIST
ncbi:hypothetical protein Tco_0620081 [Tanacetum coccineum]